MDSPHETDVAAQAGTAAARSDDLGGYGPDKLGLEARPPWNGRDLLLVLAGGTALSVVILLVYGALVSVVTGGWSDAYTEGGLTLIYLAFGIAGWQFALRRRGATWQDAGFRKPSRRAVIAIVPAYVGLVLVEGAVALASEGLFGSSPGLETQLQIPADSISLAEKLVLLLGAVVAAPLVEEFLFRGLLYRYMRSRVRVPLAVVLTSLVFAVLHGFLGLIPILVVFGVMMALLVERYKTLVPSIVLHALNNGVALTVFFLAE